MHSEEFRHMRKGDYTMAEKETILTTDGLKKLEQKL